MNVLWRNSSNRLLRYGVSPENQWNSKFGQTRLSRNMSEDEDGDDSDDAGRPRHL
jgi:hypothetical protein